VNKTLVSVFQLRLFESSQPVSKHQNPNSEND
jgi:hypothetical protein